MSRKDCQRGIYYLRQSGNACEVINGFVAFVSGLTVGVSSQILN